MKYPSITKNRKKIKQYSPSIHGGMNAMATNNLALLPTQPSQNQIRDSSLSALTNAYRNWLKVRDVMSEDIATIDPQCNVASAARIMSTEKISCLIVLKDGQLSGIVTETDVLKKGIVAGHNFHKIKVEQIMSSPVRSIPHSASVMDASRIMESKNIRRLVVVLEEGERPVGIITQTDLVRVLSSYTASIEVSEILTRNAVMIASSASASEAAELMASQDISCLVVMDDAAVVGIFTERDFLKRVVALNKDPAKMTLKQVMSKPVVTIPANYSLLSATKLLERAKIRRLVVTDYDTLLGVITQTDILRALKTTLQDEEKKYFRLLDESYSCIFAVDMDLNTTYINHAFMRLLDVMDPDELIDKPFLPERFWEVPGQRDQLLNQLRRIGATVHELSLKTTRGKKRSVLLFVMPNKNIKGHVNGNHGILYDITAQP